jgi:hypothetical protein
MKLIILKTDIQNSSKLEILKRLFRTKKEILDWSIDMEDRDNVLRIQARNNLEEGDIIRMTRAYNLLCEELTY